LQDKFRRQFIGQQVTVIVEGSSGKIPHGRCERYFMVNIPQQNADCKAGTIHSFLLTEDCLPMKEDIVE
jgi:hypothetical protein